MLDEILKRQREFQKLCGINIDTILASEINSLSENFIFKAIEEMVELRKTFPSELNKWSKSRPLENRRETLDELSDSLLFLANFMLAKKISVPEMLESIQRVQRNNFIKLKYKRLAIFNEERLKVPSLTMPGNGEPMPKVIFVDMAPFPDSEFLWHKSNKFLNEAIQKAAKTLGYNKGDVYFTTIVKEAVPKDSEPTRVQIDYWYPSLVEEIKIIQAGTDAKVYTLGKLASQILMQKGGISYTPLAHPDSFIKNGFTIAQYIQEHLIKTKIEGVNNAGTHEKPVS